METSMTGKADSDHLSIMLYC